jgi:UDP-3-O-[3-hydroxymyristoyl] glucosamine N-acyltransferase
VRYRLNSPVMSNTLAAELGLQHCGDPAEICAVAPLQEAGEGDLTFSRLSPLSKSNVAVLICSPECELLSGSIIKSANPRLDFARALTLLQSSLGFELPDHEPIVDPSAEIGRNVVIERGVSIGPGSRIEHGVVLHRGVTIGRNCTIRANSVIGGDGFGFERDESGKPVRLTHLGSVVVHDEVEIGALNTVARGALGDTSVGARTKTDDHVHIAHNVTVGEDCLITACAEISGSVRIGDRVWLGPNCSIMQKVTIGDDAVVGLGAVVTRSVSAGCTVTGNPAEELRLFTRKRAALNALAKGD